MSQNFDGIDQLQFPAEFNIEREILTKIISLPIPLDGGWGWLVVMASFIFNMIVDGILGSVGVLIPSMQETFKISVFDASLVISIFYSLTYAISPFVGYLFDRFGVRPVCLLSSLLGAGTFLCSYYVTSYAIIFLTLGILPGFALCTLSLSAQVMVGFYFDKRRPVALSISSLGSSFGSSIFPIILSSALAKFGWNGTLLLIAGIVTLSIPASLAMRPLSPPQYINKQEMHSNNSTTALAFNIKQSEHSPVKAFHMSLENIPFLNHKEPTEDRDNPLLDALIVCHNKVTNPDISGGNLSYLTSSTHTCLGSTCSNIREIRRESDNVPDLVSKLIQLVEYKISKKAFHVFSLSEGDLFRKKFVLNRKSECVTAQAKKLLLKLINKIYNSPYSKYELLHVESRHTLAEKGFIASEHDLKSLVNIPTIDDVVHNRGPRKIFFDASIFKSPYIVMYYITSFLIFCAVLLPYIFMIQLTQDYCKHGDMLISLLGVGGMISRFASGFIIEHAGVDVFMYNDGGIFLMFFSCLLFPILRNSLAGMAINSIVYGISYGTVFYTPPLIFCNSLGIQKLTGSLSIHMFIKGIGYIIGIIGFGKSVDSIGPKSSFFIGCGLIVLAAISITLTRIFQKNLRFVSN